MEEAVQVGQGWREEGGVEGFEEGLMDEDGDVDVDVDADIVGRLTVFGTEVGWRKIVG